MALTSSITPEKVRVHSHFKKKRLRKFSFFVMRGIGAKVCGKGVRSSLSSGKSVFGSDVSKEKFLSGH